MTAAVYAAEIREQYDCADCVHPHEWKRRGRCTGPIPDGEEQLRIRVWDSKARGYVDTAKAYEEKFSTCPRGMIRADLHPDEVQTAALVSQGVAAEVKHRWPDVPARLWALMGTYESAQARKMRDEQEAAFSR